MKPRREARTVRRMWRKMVRTKTMKRTKRPKASPTRPRKAAQDALPDAADAAQEKALSEKMLPVEDSDSEALHEVESELGISEWIDPDTGGPAEDSVPRLEDH
jgi:hypothetical protein